MRGRKKYDNVREGGVNELKKRGKNASTHLEKRMLSRENVS